MYSEIGFIFNPVLDTALLGNRDNEGDIYGRINMIRPRPKKDANTKTSTSTGSQSSSSEDQPTSPAILVFKKPNAYGTVNIKNYLKNNVYANDDTNEDPYISLINYFSKPSMKALKLKAADFAYLKDLGVYPINRLWILRRFPDNAVVPNNLLEWGKSVEPISTVVGWFKNKEEADLLSFSFSELWTDQTETLDIVIGQILQQMGIKGASNIVAVPGWSQGFLFGMLESAGLTSDYNAMNVPTGDPNVLRTAKMREWSGSQAIQSNMSLSLETSYEQKYINGIDPGMAMLDILGNLFKMGTSEMKFILTKSEALQKLIGAAYGPAQGSTGAWIGVIVELVQKFLTGIEKFVENLSKEGTSLSSEAGGMKTDAKSAVPDTSFLSSAKNMVSKIADTFLAGTVYKYRWPLKGSLGLMSGINTTPWHLTIGNPYSPIINIGNMWVNGVDVKLSNDMGFNDMPIRIDTTISCQFGRPLGRSELERMFNNGYKRVYSKGSNNAITPEATEASNAVTPDQTNASTKVAQNQNLSGAGSGNQDQPAGTLSRIDKSVNPNGDLQGKMRQLNDYGGGKFGGGGAAKDWTGGVDIDPNTGRKIIK